MSDLAGTSTSEVLDWKIHAQVLETSAAPIWLYDSSFCSNIWGNSAAVELFQVDSEGFASCQTDQLDQWSPDQLMLWKKLNAQVHQDVEVDGKDMNLTVTSQNPVPGFLKIAKVKLVLKAALRKLTLKVDGAQRTLTMITVVHQSYTDVNDIDLRMVEMCNNHPMFQFLFDVTGKLLAANKRAMYNMSEHLGSSENYSLQQYLAIGESDGCTGPDEMYQEAMDAIFKHNKPSHRFPQLRWSKRHPGKYRWVLYELWPLMDPITHQTAILVCEQNISQVKALEEQFKKQNQRLEATLEEALAQRDPLHKPPIDIDTPADKTLKLLDKIMRGHEVAAREAIELRDVIMQAGDLRQPVNFNDQLMKNSQTVLDNEVSQSLIQLLSYKKPAKLPGIAEEAEPRDKAMGAQDVHSMYSKSQVTSEGVMALIALQKNLPDELMERLSHVDDWQFDAFKLSEVSEGRPLSMLGFVLFKRCEMFEKFKLDETKLVKFLMRVEDGYPTNPYHNRIHAADVLQSLHVLVVRGGLLQHGYCDDVMLMSCYLSAIVHDFEHKGVNNDYLIRVSDMLALLYNDRSPMENHHLAASFQLMNSDEFNFMRKVPHKIKETMRKQIIEMVLATDMKQHFAIHSMFQAKMQLNGARPSGGGSGGKAMRTSPHTAEPVIVKPIEDDQKSLVLQVALKCADLGHLASPRTVHKKWVQKLEEEFFRQGDREKQNGLGVSPLMDRDKNGITKSQVGFFDIVALPLFQSFSQAFPDATPMTDAVKDNYAMWREESALYSSAPNVSGATTTSSSTATTAPPSASTSTGSNPPK